MLYRDPSECVDTIRKMKADAERKAKRDRNHKAMRIKATVRNLILGIKR